MTQSRIRSIEVPDEEQSALAHLIRLTDPALGGLERALCQAKPTLDRQEFLSQLRREPLISEISDVDEIVSSLVNVAGTAYSEHVGIDEFVKVLVDQIQKDNVVDISSAEAEALRDRLGRLASTKCLELIAKGNLLLGMNDRNYSSAQITTDFRPVFLGDEPKVSAGVILHQLAIKAAHNGRSETAYFSLDTADLTALSEVIARALVKANALREVAEKAGTPILTTPPGE